jgi:ribosomal RNA-processing protein 36
MPRRPRSAARVPPKKNATNVVVEPKAVLRSASVSSPNQSEEDDSDEQEDEHESGTDSAEESVLQDENDEDVLEDVDAPRVSQWVDDDDLDPTSYRSEDEDQTSGAGPSQLVRIYSICFFLFSI